MSQHNITVAYAALDGCIDYDKIGERIRKARVEASLVSWNTALELAAQAAERREGKEPLETTIRALQMPIALRDAETAGWRTDLPPEDGTIVIAANLGRVRFCKSDAGWGWYGWGSEAIVARPEVWRPAEA